MLSEIDKCFISFRIIAGEGIRDRARSSATIGRLPHDVEESVLKLREAIEKNAIERSDIEKSDIEKSEIEKSSIEMNATENALHRRVAF